MTTRTHDLTHPATSRVLPGPTTPYDSQSPGKSQLFRNCQNGKMEAAEMIATSRTFGSFSPADVLAIFGPGFLSPDVCRAWIYRRLHPEGAHCPGCGARIDRPESLQRFWTGERLRCPACRKYFTAQTGTMITGTHMDPQQICLMALLIALHWSPAQIAKTIGECAETVRIWRRKFAALNLDQETPYAR